jgi:magnesium-transporting ATPase (P-type)
MFIRDMNPNGSTNDGDSGLYLFMKGAPERILNRCTKILINGEERPYHDYEDDVEFANKSFGSMGERVLAFARVKLNPKIYTKNPAYKFDIKNWKKW